MVRSIYLFILASFCGYMAAAQSSPVNNISKKAAEKWMEHGSWRKGFFEKPAPSINAQTFYIQYHKHPEWWEKAFVFLNRKDLSSLATGNYPIVGQDVYASISTYVPKDFDKTQWEAHRKYADIQCMIEGEEKIGESPISKLAETVPYNESKDAANYKGPGKYYVARPGTFFIFFPGEGHRPNIKVNAGDTMMVKKIVIKMRVDYGHL
ncbi:MAG: YhcH/YjgK/YiaL family protein [Chitinophagaceae bacterium]